MAGMKLWAPGTVRAYLLCPCRVPHCIRRPGTPISEHSKEHVSTACFLVIYSLLSSFTAKLSHVSLLLQTLHFWKHSNVLGNIKYSDVFLGLKKNRVSYNFIIKRHLEIIHTNRLQIFQQVIFIFKIPMTLFSRMSP